VFTATGHDDRGLKSFDIPDYSLVKRINGTEQNYWRGADLLGLSFAKNDGTEITKISIFHTTFGKEAVLSDDEEIIGIYGTKEVSDIYFA
jgi:hypothetical protein